MMEPMRRRGMETEFDRQSNQILATQDLSNKEKKTPKDIDSKNELFLAVCIPFIILIIFGGRPCLLTLTFGGLICYIFDLLGSVEVHILFGI